MSREDRRAIGLFTLTLLLILIAPSVGAFLRTLSIYN